MEENVDMGRFTSVANIDDFSVLKILRRFGSKYYFRVKFKPRIIQDTDVREEDLKPPPKDPFGAEFYTLVGLDLLDTTVAEKHKFLNEIRLFASMSPQKPKDPSDDITQPPSPFIIRYFGCFISRRKSLICMLLEDLSFISFNDLIFRLTYSHTRAEISQVWSILAQSALFFEEAEKWGLGFAEMSLKSFGQTEEGEVKLFQFEGLIDPFMELGPGNLVKTENLP